MKHKRIRSVSLVLMLAASSLAATAPVVSAGFGDGHVVGQRESCTMGDAQALLDAFGQFFASPLGPPPCQYRLYWEEMTFCEDDVILGGIVYWWTYHEMEELGWSRSEAIADMELVRDRVWLDGAEQTMTVTAYKDANNAQLGRLVYNHRAYTTRLLPGDHLSSWVQTYPGYPDFTATTVLHVLPRELCV